IIESASKKMIYRHPHVFKNDSVETSEEVLVNWEELKKKEKKYNTISEEIDGIAKTLPALTKAHKVQKKVAKVGFDFKNVNEAATKVEEELKEVLDVYKSNNREKIINEIGDLIFACVNVSRMLSVDEEEALNTSIKKFSKRFSFIEKSILDSGKNIEEVSIDDMNKLWE
ncbi:MazG family protein, partial [Clostridium saudiense]|nr:MazG family protein [Clostridium saudiense]